VKYLLSFIVGFCVLGVGCSWFQKNGPTVGPPVANFGICVALDATKGDSILQIVNDCGGDINAVVEALLSSSDPQVLATKAVAEANDLQMKLVADAAKKGHK